MTPATFSAKWNQRAAAVGCPARGKWTGKSGFKAFEFRGEESKGHEVWWPIATSRFFDLCAKFPAVNQPLQ